MDGFTSVALAPLKVQDDRPLAAALERLGRQPPL